MAQKKDFKAGLVINGEDFGDWDQLTGGAYDADETKYTPADGIQRTYLGNPTIGNVTLERDYRPSRDGDLVRRRSALHDSPATITVLDKDPDGNFQQNREPYIARVKMISPPEIDSDGSDVAKIQIELSTGVPG